MLEIRPVWDPTDQVTVRVCGDQREVEVSTDAETLRYRLRDSRPDRLGWVEERSDRGRGPVRQRVTVSYVVLACLREWDAEEQVIELTLKTAKQARERGRRWQEAAEALTKQASAARSGRRVSPLPLQVLWRHRSDPKRPNPLTGTAAAHRMGVRTKNGREDTQRFKRRLGIAHSTEGGRRVRPRAIAYETGVALCRALDVCPTDLGL